MERNINHDGAPQAVPQRDWARPTVTTLDLPSNTFGDPRVFDEGVPVSSST
ncbi:hypothetical protein V6768_24000 [Tistrella mobilis]